jgi:hypothetical protein
MSTTAPELPEVITGTLHIHVAFDWGDEINLAVVSSIHGTVGKPLPRRRRTPSSVEYRPLPLRFGLAPVALALPELGNVTAPAEATIFDFAGVSVALEVPFRLSPAALLQLAAHLAEPGAIVSAVRGVAEPLYQQLLPGIADANFSPLSEEYFVFQLPPGGPLQPEVLLDPHAGWLAGVVRLEAGSLSADEVAEALRRHISYSPADLFVADWAAALLLDSDCEETLQAIEFANLQLLEFRHIDNRLDDNLGTAYSLIRPARTGWRERWSSHGRGLRLLGELKVEATGLFERTSNVLKLIGDPYLARLYRMLSMRFYLPQWEANIRGKLEVLEGVYRTIADQAATFRAEALEVTVIVLIALEIILAVLRH